MLKRSYFLLVLFLFQVGCVAGGPQLSIDPQQSPGGTPTGGPTARPAGETQNRLPSLQGPFQGGGSGSVVSRSSRFNSFGSMEFHPGSVARSERFQMVNPHLALGQTRIGQP